MEKVKRKQKRYSDDERARAVAAVAANGGNVTKTAKELGIPQPTLDCWVRGVVHPEVNGNSVAQKKPLAEAFGELAAKLIGCITQDKIDDAPLWEVVKSAATAVDKKQLLEGKATVITAKAARDMSDADLDREIERLEREEIGLAAGTGAAAGEEAA